MPAADQQVAVIGLSLIHIYMCIRDRVMGSPPHARGIPANPKAKEFGIGITPACAGNTVVGYHIVDPCRDHPRMRGEYLAWSDLLKIYWGSPPHARGILNRGLAGDGSYGITPACAGNTVMLTCG